MQLFCVAVLLCLSRLYGAEAAGVSAVGPRPDAVQLSSSHTPLKRGKHGHGAKRKLLQGTRIKHPNFVILLTDDQDELYNSTDPYYMPALDRLMGRDGTKLSQFVVPTPECCPARTSMLTGQYAHCTNVTSNEYPGGGYQKFYEQQTDKDWLPLWLQQAGYQTHLIGKFLNEYDDQEDFTPEGYVPKGWTSFDALVHDSMFTFNNNCFAGTSQQRTCYNGEQYYQTDLLRDMAINKIRSFAALRKDTGFFMFLAPTAPHKERNPFGKNYIPPRPAPRHANLYSGDKVRIPKGANWGLPNPNIMPETPFTEASVAALEQLYLERIRSMRAIDEMLDAIYKELTELDLVDSTYVIYASDNGYHMGSFGLNDGKLLPVEEDIIVPFYIAGPGIPSGVVHNYQGSMIDVAPTIMALAGLPIPDSVNGLPMPLSPDLQRAHVEQLLVATPSKEQGPPGDGLIKWWRRDGLVLEGWRTPNNNRVLAMQPYNSPPIMMRVYKALRLCTNYKVFNDSGSGSAEMPARAAASGVGPRCYKYVAWCSQGVRELYDLSTDPYETRNRISEAPQAVLDRMDALMSVLAHCKGVTCRNPYALLHTGKTQANVLNFVAAMSSAYDARYRSLAKFRYTTCAAVYRTDFELVDPALLSR